MDYDFEFATAQRLIELSSSRQVVIFTHRISLLWQLDNLAEKQGIKINTIAIDREKWGTGNPRPLPLKAQRPDKELNNILGERIARARKAENKGKEFYEIEMKGICLDTRLVIEKLIEKELIGDVISRFRREIITNNKLDRLAKITSNDCAIVDEAMTYWSQFKHSQSDDTPMNLPSVDEAEAQVKKIKTWLDEFRARVAS